MFKSISAKFGERIAIIDSSGTELTYDELEKFAIQIEYLIPQGSLIFSLCSNSLESLKGYFSFVRNGLTTLMLDASLDQELLSNLVDMYMPEYVWLPKERKSDFDQANTLFSCGNYVLMQCTIENKYKLHKDLALLLTTSGSTGSPKLVKITLNNLESNAKSIAEYLSLNKDERPITTLPMNYSFGLSIINSHLIVGATILLTSKSLMERDFWLFLKEQKATSISGVPYSFEILNKLRFFNSDIPSIKTITQAGGKLNNKLNKEVSEYCQKFDKKFFVMYGQTEATARMSYLPSDLSLEKLGSIGIAIPGGEFSLIDDVGETICGDDIVGELVYKGNNVSMGYAVSGEDLSKEDVNNGVLYTGDLAKRDKDDYYYIVGRRKRFIKIYGNRVNLDETERLLKDIISDCACIGEDDHMCVFVNDQDRIDEIKNFISLKIRIHHSAFSVRFIDEIPKNYSGKTNYSSLKI
jgi:acyl-CoA synthetase (AMP-forming)/AMP-acid ligase II